MLRFLVPHFPLSDLPRMLVIACCGAVIAGCYGVVHDQVTFSIGSEYFTHFKFAQFRQADPGWGDRYFVTVIGFLATWWVGFVFAWFFSRRYLPNQVPKQAYRQISKAFLTVLVIGAAFGVLGYGYGTWSLGNGSSEWWQPVFDRFQIRDHVGFRRVAYIHNFSYLGGFVGFLTACCWIRPVSPHSYDPSS